MKLLIIGQIPKEHGGSYTTGVANVITNLLPYLPGEKYLWASNYRSKRKSVIFETQVYGTHYYNIIISILRYTILFPSRLIQFSKYKKFGLPFFRNVIYEACINSYISKCKPDVIHIHNGKFLPSLYYAKEKSISNIVYTYHGIQYTNPDAITQNAKLSINLPKLMLENSKLLKNITVLTESMKNEAKDYFNCSDSNISIISNGVSGAFEFDIEKRMEVRMKLKISDKIPLFISVGALTKLKNHIGAIHFLQNNFEDFRYIIIGKDGDFASNVKEAVDSDERIILFSYINNNKLYQYYSASDYFIMPSSQEGQPLVSLEAFSCGLPVLINKDIEGTLGVDKEIFGEYYFPINLTQKNFDCPSTLTNNDRLKLAKLSSIYLTWENVGKQYKALYNTIQ